MGAAHHPLPLVGEGLHCGGGGVPPAVGPEGGLPAPALGGGQKADALPRRLHPQDAHHGGGAALPALGGAGAAGQAGGQQEQEQKQKGSHPSHPCLLWFWVPRARSRNFTQWVGQRITPWPWARSPPEAAKGVR